MVAVFALAVIPILTMPIVPAIDFYSHIGRFYVLANLDDAPALKQFYASNWSLLPNIGLDVLGAFLMQWFPPLVTAKLILFVMFASQYFGVLFFNRQLSGRYSWVVAALAVPLLYSFIFTWGFANFLFGLGLAFWGGGTWLALRRRRVLSTIVGCLWAVVVFLTHGVAFALYGVLIGGLELGFFLTGSDRRPRAAILTLCRLAVQAVLPAVLFLQSATVKAHGGITSADESLKNYANPQALSSRLFEIATYRLSTIIRVAEGPSFWFDLVVNSVTAAILIALVVKGRVTIPRPAWPVWLIGALLVIIVPPALFGVGYVSDRMPLFLAFAVIGSCVTAFRGDAFERLALGLLVGLALLRLFCVDLSWQRYRQDFTDFKAVASSMPPHQVVGYVNVKLDGRTGRQPRCEMFGPLMVAMYGHGSGLFASQTAQPLRQVGRLTAALKAHPSPGRLEGAAASAVYSETLRIDSARGKFDFILVCDADRLMEPIDPGLPVAARRGRFTLLRVAATTAQNPGPPGQPTAAAPDLH